MIPSAVPRRPWQMVGTDLFCLKGQAYLLVVDYFSRYIEISTLRQSLPGMVYSKLSGLTTEHSTLPQSLSNLSNIGALSTLLAAQNIHSLMERPNAPCRPSRICLRKCKIHTQPYLPTEPYGPWNRDAFQPNCYLA